MVRSAVAPWLSAPHAATRVCSGRPSSAGMVCVRCHPGCGDCANPALPFLSATNRCSLRVCPIGHAFGWRLSPTVPAALTCTCACPNRLRRILRLTQLGRHPVRSPARAGNKLGVQFSHMLRARQCHLSITITNVTWQPCEVPSAQSPRRTTVPACQPKGDDHLSTFPSGC